MNGKAAGENHTTFRGKVVPRFNIKKNRAEIPVLLDGMLPFEDGEDGCRNRCLTGQQSGTAPDLPAGDYFASTGFFTFDLNGVIREVDEAGARMFGTAQDHMLQKKMNSMINPGFRDAFLSHCKQVVVGTQPRHCNLVCVGNDGAVFYVHLQSTAVRDRDGHALAIRSTLVDITAAVHQERRPESRHLQRERMPRSRPLRSGSRALQSGGAPGGQIGQELKKSKTALDVIFTGITEPFFLLDENGLMVAANRAACDYYGTGGGIVSGEACYKAFLRRQRICEGCRIIPALKDGRQVSFEQCSLIDPPNTEQVNIFPFSTRYGTLFTIHIQDTTVQKACETGLIQQERLSMLGALLAGIAHEIQNPNNLIAMNLPVLREYLKCILPCVRMHAERDGRFRIFNMSFEELSRELEKLITSMERGSDRISSTISNMRYFVT